MRKLLSLLLILCLLLPAAVLGEEAAPAETAPADAASAADAQAAPGQDNLSVTRHTATIAGKQIDYTATAGTMAMETELGKYEIFFIAYTVDGTEDYSKRPVTFAFNGGPGSASLWLNLGLLGPERIDLRDEGMLKQAVTGTKPNEYSILDMTDLVFIDPVGTGFSGVLPGTDEETFYTVRGLIKQFVRFYNYLAQVERTYNRDLYRTYIFCDLLLKLIKTKPHERPDLNKQLMLVNSRIEAGETQSIHLDKNSGGLSTPKPGAGNGPDDKRDLLSNIIDKVNMMFRGNFTKEDRVLVESIYDKLNQPKVRRKLTKQAKNNDPKQFAESIFPEVFAEAAQECYGDQMEAFRRLFQNHDLYNSIMSQMGNMMYANFRAQDEAVFNPERFKQKIIPTLETEFAGFKILPKPFPQVAEDLVTIIAAKTTDDIDGANDVIQNAFNRLYCSPVKVSFVDKKQHFNTLVSRFEVFLKKVYYLRNHTTIVSTKPGSEGQKATLADCIYQTPCLKRLKYDTLSEAFEV